MAHCRHNVLEGEYGKKEELNWMECSVAAKFQKLGVSLPKTLASVVQEELNVHEMGKKLFQTLSQRIQLLMWRSCALGNDGSSMLSISYCSFLCRSTSGSF